MNMKKVTVGIIGCGTIANGAHIPAYMKNEDVEIKYFCDIIPERAKEAVEKYGQEVMARLSSAKRGVKMRLRKSSTKYFKLWLKISKMDYPYQQMKTKIKPPNF